MAKNDIFVESLEPQPDGRLTIIFKNEGQKFRLKNLSVASHGEYARGTGNDSEQHYFLLGFEAVEFEDKNPLQRII